MPTRARPGTRCNRREALKALEAWATAPVDEVLARLHPGAVIVPRAAGGVELRGRDAIREWLAESRRWIHYRIQPINLLPLSDDAVVVTGRVQWMKQDAVFRETYCVWSVEFRDGLVYRSIAFPSIGEAGRGFPDQSGAPPRPVASAFGEPIHASERVRVVAPVEGLPAGAEGSVVGFYRRSEQRPSGEDSVVVQFEDGVRELSPAVVAPLAPAEAEAHSELRCSGCDLVATGDAAGWRAFRTDRERGRPGIALYCPDCGPRRPSG
jgi:hypothetical protein